MTIRTSATTEIDRLLAQLVSTRTAAREGAIARLAVIGTRAVARICALAEDAKASGEARAAAFRTLEAIGDVRALDPALRAVFDTDETVAIAAIGVARLFVKTPRGMAVLDRLTALATDKRRTVRIRLAAIDALRTLAPATVEPLVSALQSDPSVKIAMRGTTGSDAAGTAAARIESLMADSTGLDLAALKQAVVALPAECPMPLLQRLVDRIRERERQEPVRARAEWSAARAAVHVALAREGSRLALYDLRETLETADEGLPVGFLTALSVIGDQSCLPAIAAAYARAGRSPRGWWQSHLIDVFRAILARERLTRRHPTAKKIQSRWPEAFQLLWPEPATRRVKTRPSR